MKQKLILSLFAAAAIGASAQSQGYKDGIEYYKAGQYDNAKTILNKTLDNSETNKSLALYYLGQVALAQDDKQAAKDYFDKGIAADPNCGYNYVGLGAVDLLNGQTSQANDNFKKAQGLAKKDNELIVAIARAYYNADPVKYANEINKNLDKARKSSKYQEPAIYILEGDMLADNKEWGNAAGKYEMAITYDQENPEGYVKYANTYFNVNKDFAIGKLEELYNRTPTLHSPLANSPKNTIRATTGTKPLTSTAHTSRTPTTSPKTKPVTLCFSTGATNMKIQRELPTKFSLKTPPTSSCSACSSSTTLRLTTTRLLLQKLKNSPKTIPTDVSRPTTLQLTLTFS